MDGVTNIQSLTLLAGSFDNSKQRREGKAFGCSSMALGTTVIGTEE